MKRKLMRFICLAMALLAAVTVACAAICSLTIDYQYSDATFDLYHVACLSESGIYEKTDPFEDCPVDVSSINTSNYPTYAATLEGYVMLNNPQPTYTGKTDGEGQLYFPNLAEGLYLIIPHSVTSGEKTYITQPMLLNLPMADETGVSWLYDVTISPKPEEVPDIEPDETVSRKVLKKWNDGGNESLRPESITIYLLKNGEVFDTVELTAEDNWRYRWDELSAQHTWTVAEEPVDNYNVTIFREGTTFLVTNTHTSIPTPKPPVPTPKPPSGDEPEPDIPGVSPIPESSPGVTPVPETTPVPEITPEPVEPSAPDVPTLPQTGLLWWPVPVMAFAGLLLVIFGLIRRRGTDYGE